MGGTATNVIRARLGTKLDHYSPKGTTVDRKVKAIAEAAWDLDRTTEPSFQRLVVTPRRRVIAHQNRPHNEDLGSLEDVTRQLATLATTIGVTEEERAYITAVSQQTITDFGQISHRALRAV